MNGTMGGANLLGNRDADKRTIETMGGVDASAFLCAGPFRLAGHALDMGNYYTGAGVTWPGWGFYGRVWIQRQEQVLLRLKAFNLLTKYESRIAVQMPKNAKDIWVLAGRKENGQAAILVSCFKSPACEIKLDIENLKIAPARVHYSTLSTQGTTSSYGPRHKSQTPKIHASEACRLHGLPGGTAVGGSVQNRNRPLGGRSVFLVLNQANLSGRCR